MEWSTATETNNSGFDIERKGKSSDWLKIGFISGNGTSTGTNLYSYEDNTISSGIYSYRLKQLDFNGTSSYSKTIEVNTNALSEFSLNQNYPNPFNPATKISFTVPQTSNVNFRFSMYSVKKLLFLLNGEKSPGKYDLSFNGSGLTSGVYIYRIEAVPVTGQAAGFVSIKKDDINKIISSNFIQ